jgi:hypothetical protein
MFNIFTTGFLVAFSDVFTFGLVIGNFNFLHYGVPSTNFSLFAKSFVGASPFVFLHSMVLTFNDVSAFLFVVTGHFGMAFHFPMLSFNFSTNLFVSTFFYLS